MRRVLGSVVGCTRLVDASGRLDGAGPAVEV